MLETREQVKGTDSGFERRNVLPSGVHTTLTRLAVGDGLTPCSVAGVFEAVVGLLPPVRDVVLGSLMTAVMARGPISDELVALLRGALDVDERPAQHTVTGIDRPVVVLAGSGKKGRRTLNVSTPAALVAAAAGAQVVKIGSAATSSALGSRDLVRALGLPECRTAASVRRALGECGVAFVPVEPEIPVLDHLYGGRFHAPNPFSFGLAPLVSPVRGDITVFGLSHPRVDVAAQVLGELGMEHVAVVSTRLPTGEYLDEIAPTGQVLWCSYLDGRLDPVRIRPAHELVDVVGVDVPKPCDARQATEHVRDLLAGGGLREHRVIVVVNAAHLLVLSGIAASPGVGYAMAEDALRSGAALTNLTRARLKERSCGR